MFKQKGNKLIYFYDNETVLVEPWGENSFRVRVTHNEEFTDHDWALLSEKKADINLKPETQIEIEEYESKEQDGILDMDHGDEQSYAEIKNGKLVARFNSHGVLTFKNNKGETLLKENWRRRKDEPSMSLEIEGREMKPVEGDNYRATLRFKANAGEKIYGMGQYQHNFLNLKGCSLELAQRNSQASVPFFISNQGYGFLWNNPAIGSVNFAKNGTEWVAKSTKQMDYWITAGDSPAEIQQRYADVTGKVPMMPDYAMGLWQSKLRYRTQEEVLEVARKYKELGLPLDVIVIDFFHWTQQGDYKFDPEYWPDPEKMIEELNAMDIEVMVSFWPSVDYRSENFAEMMEKGYLVRTEEGVRVTMQFFGQEVFLDPTNPEAQKFVWNKVKENYWDKGIKMFWLDIAEPEYTGYDFGNYRYYLGSDLEVGNIYPAMYSKTFYEGMKEEGLENPINLVRCAWAGSQKYGTLVWSGDIDCTFNSLQRQIKAGLSMGLAGIPWVTTDIGGFQGANIHDEDFKKLLIRWFQFACFSPVMRMHGYRQPGTHFDNDFIAGVGQMGTGAENEIWSYGEEYFEIMKDYLFLRERLRPYIKDQMKKAHEDGTPVMRTLFYEFPEDQNCWDIDDQYLFGPDILVAPIVKEEQYEREVYLPEGSNWTNPWTNEEFEGGQTISVEADLETIPVFLKDEAKLPIKG